jgi:hypothetical protein
VFFPTDAIGAEGAKVLAAALGADITLSYLDSVEAN